MESKIELKVAVRALAEFVHRAGDIAHEYTGAARSLEGIRGHQTIQRSRPDTYLPEVAVSHLLETQRFILNISGRIDGVDISDSGVTIDEIKTTARDPDTITIDRYPVHWAQAKIYGYIYAREHHVDPITVQLTYYQIGTGKIRELRQVFSFLSLEAFYADTTDCYLLWAEALTNWWDIRNKSIHALTFPFAEYRPGQRAMAVAVYRAIQNKQPVIVQAATGIGKTMAAIFPAVKAMAENLNGKIFYLTARTTGRQAAEQALSILHRTGLKLKTITLTAKEKICFCPGRTCIPEECEFAKGHYDRLDDALKAAFSEDALTREAVEAIARRHRVCPFELSLDLSLWMDCIVCDYNYVFDPRVYLRRFFNDGDRDYTFLIDEAHNLVDRAREMFSAEIRKQPFLAMRRAVKDSLPGLYKKMGRINSHLVDIRKTCDLAGGWLASKDPPSDLYPLLKDFMASADRWLARNLKNDFRQDLLELYFSVAGFMRVSEKFDETYTLCCDSNGKELRVKLFCLDPSRQLKEALERGRDSIFFSGTLTPGNYFKEIFGCGEDTRILALPSPFPVRHLGLFISAGLSTLYRHRKKTAGGVAGILSVLAGYRPGNYLFYFPSYEYLNMVLDRFEAISPSAEVLIQTPGMDEPAREAFLQRFQFDSGAIRVGFAVMGGIFGEGIDLTGDRLAGVAIVGVGLPGLSPERDLIRNYFQTNSGAGFEYAYLYPGINKVLQAAGRVIRTERDRGVVLLIDQRYATNRYHALFPSHWQPIPIKNPEDLKQSLTRFWS